MSDDEKKDEFPPTLFGFPILPAEEGTFKEFREHRDKIIFGTFGLSQENLKHGVEQSNTSFGALKYRKQFEGTFIEETPESLPVLERERRYQIMHYLAALYPNLSEFQTWKIAGRVIQLCEGRDYYGRPEE